jgi:hypothetical protein
MLPTGQLFSFKLLRFDYDIPPLFTFYFLLLTFLYAVFQDREICCHVWAER